MTNLESVHNTSSHPTPVADDQSGPRQALRGRLAQALDTAQKLYVDAQWLSIETDELWVDLKKIAGADVVDSVTWLNNAAMNIEDEFGVLIDRLFGAIDNLNTNTD